MATKKQRLTEYRKVQDKIKMLGGQPGGWTKIDKEIKVLKKNTTLTDNDIKSMKQWIETEKKARKEHLKTELQEINDFFKQYKENPKILVQMGLYRNGFDKNNPMYDSLLDAQKLDLKECELQIKFGFKPLTASFAWMNDEEWQNLMRTRCERKHKALTEAITAIETDVVKIEEQIQVEKEEKDKRVSRS
jgi:hypothetical protein